MLEGSPWGGSPESHSLRASLFAMRIAPISRVAPAREMSMIIGAYLGTRTLGEGHVARRLIASLLVATGVAALVYGCTKNDLNSSTLCNLRLISSIERDLFLGGERPGVGSREARIHV